jgi:hypothetical protein
VRVLDYDSQYKRRAGGLFEGDPQLQAAARGFMQRKLEHDLLADLPRQVEKFFEVE